MKNKTKKKDPDITLGQLKDIRFYAFFSFALWPVIVLLSAAASLYFLIAGIFTADKKKMHKALICQYSIVLPFYLMKLSFKERAVTALTAVFLLVPFMAATVLSPFFFLFSDGSAVNNIGSQPPWIYQLFGYNGVGLFGTNSEGVRIEEIVFTGAGHVYFTSLIAVVFIFVCGLWLGKLTFYKRAEFNIMNAVEIIETIPVLFLL
ncbi:MAG: hypothetical protein AB1499_18900, partial [Nitrospirota bacterium]